MSRSLLNTDVLEILRRLWVLSRLPPDVRALARQFEADTGLRLAPRSWTGSVFPEVRALAAFDTAAQKPYIWLAKGRLPGELAATLEIVRLSLLEEYRSLVAKHWANVPWGTDLAVTVMVEVLAEAARRRLVSRGFDVAELEGPRLFELFEDWTRVLDSGGQLEGTGMDLLDKYGRSLLGRGYYYIKAKLLLDGYAAALGEAERGATEEFAASVSRRLPEVADYGNGVLAWFEALDVCTVEGHRELFRRWIELERLAEWVEVFYAERDETGQFRTCKDTGSKGRSHG